MKIKTINTIKRFFEPMNKNKMVFIKAFYIFSNWGINGVIHILFLQHITNSIELKDIDYFNKVIFLYILYFIYFYVSEFLMRKNGWVDVAQVVVDNIQEYYIKKFVRLNNTYTERFGVGKAIGIIDNGLRTWASLLLSTIEKGTYLIISLIFTIYVLVKANFLYGIVFILLFCLFYITSKYFNDLCLIHRSGRMKAKNKYTKHLVKILMSKFEILESNKVDLEIGHLKGYLDEEVKYNKNMGWPIYGLFRIPDAIILLSIIGISYFFGKQIISGNQELSIYIGISGILITMQRTMDFLLGFFKDITRDFVIIQTLWDFFDSTPEIVGYDTGKEFVCEKGTFSIKNLNYSYNEKIKVFNNFNLEIEGEKILAIVGNSGSGKTTLVKLLSGYIRQDSGNIVIDNQNIEDISLKSYYGKIGYLTQEPQVFDGTIYDNLTYSSIDIPGEKELDKIIRLSKCEFIYELPKGLQTEIGERGVRLSGGQRQRLAIAKVMLKNPKIIILDEPTSALDSFSEEQITKAMQNLFKGRTVIIIAHRLQTVKHADRIILIENGEIIEDGDHKSLIKFNGQYKKMLDLQSGF